MKFIVKLFPEIAIKSKSVRKHMSKILQGNIRNVLRRYDETITVRNDWDKMVVSSKDDSPENRERLIDALKCIPGIQSFSEVRVSSYTDLDDIARQVRELKESQLAGKSFCVRARRRGKHEFNSLDVERYVGGHLNQNCSTGGVKLKNPDTEVLLEIEDDKLYLVCDNYKGLCGYPLATQDHVLSLMSGGFDSGVSSFQLINRGSRVHYCFFNLGGAAHEIGVKEVTTYLWNRYGSSHRVRFISVPFEPIVGEILEKVDHSVMGVVLKRMMMRAASIVAERFNIPALVTGESLGQVSSQTLVNLSVIDEVTKTLILRPLIATDKQDIIDTARKIGTAAFAETMPEYCGVISQRPTVKADRAVVDAEERKFDMSLIEKVVNEAKVQDIRDVMEESNQSVQEVETATEFTAKDVILDIRTIDEVEEQPLQVEGIEVIHVPFYKLGSRFSELDSSKNYLLYCERGVMSKLQALYLQEQGHTNVRIYRG
ncbi:tRNA uracil 4-sulfurtransferase ThiI [Dongshaea marina]|uniref:tRNA uracil 4-sulfurtransferase ThiI n=1 Tax=Dongshaea marina TaxID=2047966 RepID=UPI000D3E0866|nr:tRNA uracil 4-sulfurtransferase ThiI [Dongshaea marina]